MTPQEVERIREREQARRDVLAKFSDGSAQFSDEDFKLLDSSEIHALVNAGRVPGIGVDKRLRRR